jgi:hypothetical protein
MPTPAKNSTSLSHLFNNGQCKWIEFSYENLIDGNWVYLRKLLLPLRISPELIYGGGGWMPGYNFDQSSVIGFSDDTDLDAIAAEQAFVLLNEAACSAGKLEDSPDELKSWLYHKRVTWSIR